MTLQEFLNTSYTPFHAQANAAKILQDAGFEPLIEGDKWNLKDGGKYYFSRGGSLVAFRYSKKGAYKIVASHTDSPCLKLKENAALSDGTYTRLNTEPYGGGLWYTFFDRKLKIAGVLYHEKSGVITATSYTSDFTVVLPSLAIHQNREANEKFAPNLQTELPLLALGKAEFEQITKGAIAYDLFAVPAEEAYASGANGEFLTAPRLDNLTSVYASVQALVRAEKSEDTLIAACFEAEEIGSGTRGGAGSDLLKNTLERIADAQNRSLEEKLTAYGASLFVSVDNAHALHPNHPEKCDPTNKPVLGGGVVIKGHAGGAYTTEGLTSAVVKTVLNKASVKYQTFFNRSDVRSGSTLGAISLRQVSIPSVDLGIAQLAMHSAVETMATADYAEMENALFALFTSKIKMNNEIVTIQ